MTALRISGHTVPVLRFSDFAGGWECLPLGEVGELKNGLNKDKTDFGFGFPFVNLMDVFGRSILDRTELGFVNATPAELKSYDLREGDVLFIRSSVKRDGVAAAILIPNTLPQTVFSGFLIRFRESQVNLSLEFKRYVFGTPGFRKEVLSYATTSANTNINQESLEQVAIVFPTLPEQRKIAEF
jgi:type I restriction enzyme S subunit